MSNMLRALPLGIFVYFFLLTNSAIAQAPGGAGQGSALGNSEGLVREHIEKVLEEAPEFTERYGRSVAERLVRDGRDGNLLGGGEETPREHPWARSGNPMGPIVHRFDSFFNLAAEPENAMNWSQAWSCFEPKLLAKAHDGQKIVHVKGPGNEDLIAECRAKCISQIVHIPIPDQVFPGNLIYDFLGCAVDTEDDWGYVRNGYEVAEFWFPEYQVEINNYGINRIQPQFLSPTGQQFTRQALIGQKQGIEQQIIQELGKSQSYPLTNTGDIKLPTNREDPFIGQGHWGGYASPDFQDKAYGHVIRTYLSTANEEKKVDTTAGWKVDKEKSVFGALPKRIAEHDPVNIWTEYGLFDVITSIPHMSSKIRPKVMKALFGDEAPYSQKAREKNPFYQSQGATAYRMQKWPNIYKPLERFKIQGDSNDVLKEVVLKNGYETFPLVTNMSGFGTPALSTAAVFARRVFYLAGARSPVNRGGDASGLIESAFPQGAELGRIITYTINSQDKSREIDKMQLISPKRPKDGTAYGGFPPIVSECFRSQNIPNFTHHDKDLQKWAERNMPRKLVGYWSDVDFISAQGGAIVYTYWNRRIGCFCDRCGLPTGSSTIINGGDGDRLYDKPREEYCRYPIDQGMVAWSAYHKKESFEQCEKNGKNESFYDGRGLDDKV